MTQHSRLRPSSASRWVYCPGSVLLEEKFAYLDEEHGAEGTASHYAGACALRGLSVPAVGTPADNGIILDETMIRGAQVYVDAVQSTALDAGLNVETRVNIPMVHPECSGTPDTWYYLPHVQELHVDDYKYGWGIVEAYENWQGILYAAGALLELANYWQRTLVDVAQHITVVIRIIQPRPHHVEGPIRSWRVPARDLLPYITRLHHAAAEATGPNPECRTGHHCKYCLGRHACVAAQRVGQYSIEAAYHSTPCELSPDALALEYTALLRAQEAIKLRVTGLEAQAMAIIDGGGHVPGYTVANGSGRRNWTLPVAQVLGIGDMLGIDLRKPTEAVTPNQARDKKLPANVVDGLSKIESTGKKLVPSTTTLAARVFGPNGVF